MVLVSLFFTACDASEVLPEGYGPVEALPFPADVPQLPCLLWRCFLSAMTNSALSNF